MKLGIFAGLSIMLLGGTSFAGGDAVKGKALYVVCSTCHGPNAEGIQAMNAPSLVGLQDWYLVRQLKNFKEGIQGTHPKDTNGATMKGMSMTLPDDKAIDDVVAHIVSLKK